VTPDPILVAEAEGIDALLEVTGTVEHAAHVVLRAIEHDKHVVLMNAELDGTIGPILKTYADKAGVVLSACDGDQPGVEMNLYRFVRGIGLRPLVCGNIKGLQDRTRNPTTQAGYAARWGMNVYMTTSFADGSKISFEQAIVANATGMRAPRRGLYGRDFEGMDIDALTGEYDIEELERLGGIVDYVVGAKPPPGVYVFATHDDPRQRHYLNLYKRGEGPLYSFYTPYHLCHFEVPTSVARVVLFRDAVLAPIAGPVVDVVATAKVDLVAGAVLDGIGHYLTYGQCENSDVTRTERLLPMGLAEGCRLRRDVPRDQVLTYDDVELPEGRLADQLRDEQDRRFGVGS
jgi:predicted homoserine dehydrogenase-like protein